MGRCMLLLLRLMVMMVMLLLLLVCCILMGLLVLVGLLLLMEVMLVCLWRRLRVVLLLLLRRDRCHLACTARVHLVCAVLGRLHGKEAGIVMLLQRVWLCHVLRRIPRLLGVMVMILRVMMGMMMVVRLVRILVLHRMLRWRLFLLWQACGGLRYLRIERSRSKGLSRLQVRVLRMVRGLAFRNRVL